jgi:hypothetical protein
MHVIILYTLNYYIKECKKQLDLKNNYQIPVLHAFAGKNGLVVFPADGK